MSTADIPPEVESIALKALETQVKASRSVVDAVTGQGYADGERRTVRSPIDGARLGQVLRTDPEPQWRVTDPEALHAHLREWEGCTETVYEISDMDLAIRVLRASAPEALVEITRVSQSAVDAALAQSASTGEPAAPGIEKVKPAGVLSVRPDKAAGEHIARLVQAGLLTWDGRLALPASEGAA